MSQNGESSRGETPQEEMQGAGLSPDVAAKMDSLVQSPNAREQDGGDNEPSDTVEIICAEVRKILTELNEQSEVEKHYMSTIQETVGAKVWIVLQATTACNCSDRKSSTKTKSNREPVDGVR
ncbi:hypothetical protein MTO96_006443 [Rhipicephalus appendiculatus]